MGRTKLKDRILTDESSRIPLAAIIDFIDWQVTFYEGADRQALIKASNAIYDHLCPDDPNEPHGN